MPPRNHKGENAKRHARACLMCADHFKAARPEAKTCSNKCRSFLRRWVARWGEEPISPPGVGNIRPAYLNREAWMRAYVNLPAYERLKAALKAAGRRK